MCYPGRNGFGGILHKRHGTSMHEKTYRIGEAAAKLNLKTYVLRFWEMEFSEIDPIRTEKGQRLYTEKDIALLGRIRYLLHERGLTIEGARRVLEEEAARGVAYRDAEITLPEDASAAFSEDADAAFADDAPETFADEDTAVDTAPRGDAVISEGMVQASLFPAHGYSGAGLPVNEMRRLVADLRDIHCLLMAGQVGDAP